MFAHKVELFMNVCDDAEQRSAMESSSTGGNDSSHAALRACFPLLHYEEAQMMLVFLPFWIYPPSCVACDHDL